MGDNRTLLITGASSDIGVAFLKKCSGNYERIIATYRNESEPLNRICSNLHTSIELIRCDFESSEDTLHFTNKLMNCLNRPKDFLHLPALKINNERFNKIDWSYFEKEINISLRSFVKILGTIIPDMLETGGRVLLMLSDVTTSMPPPYISSYVTVKYALLGLMKSLSAEYEKYNIKINALSPGHIETKFLSLQPDIIKQSFVDDSPIGRMLTPDDIVPFISYYLSDECEENGMNKELNYECVS